MITAYYESVCTYPFAPVWACSPGKPGCRPLDVCARAHSWPFGHVRPQNLALPLLKSMHVHVRARLGLYVRKTWLYAPTRVRPYPFVSAWACTPRKPGFTRPDEYARARSSQFGPVRPENLALRVCTCPVEPVWDCTSGKPSYTPLHECARACSCPFGPVRRGNLAVRPWTFVHVPVRARLDLYAWDTKLYASARVCACLFVLVSVCRPRKPGLTPSNAYVCAHSSPFGPLGLENLAVRPWASVHVPVCARLGLYARKIWSYAP